MRHRLVAVLVALAVPVAAGCSDAGPPGGHAAPAADPPVVGILMVESASEAHLVGGDVRAEVGRLGGTAVRLSQQVTQPCKAEVRDDTAAGLSVNMVVKAGPGTASSPPPDLDGFAAQLDGLLADCPPDLLAVENEETVDKFYAGSPEQYLAELAAAAGVAHAHGVPVTNGGLPSVVVALATWNHLRTTDPAGAGAYLDAVFDTPTRHLDALATILRRYPADAGNPYDDPASGLPPGVGGQWREAERLLAAYRTAPIDAVNIHWYATDEDGYDQGDADALAATVAFVGESTGKPVVTNEIGQWGRTPEAPARTLAVLADAHVGWIVWFDADGDPADALHDAASPGHPARLRPNGLAFRDALAELGW